LPQTKYEVRGLKFTSMSNKMAMSRRCTFAVSLRLASGSYWVSHYLFLDDTGYTGNVRLSDPKSVIAKGSGAPPGHLNSDAVWPKEVLEAANRDAPRSKAKLRYIRKKGAKAVVVQIDVWAKKFHTVQFNLLEETAASENEIIEMNGKVSLAEQSDYRPQILQRGPWGSPKDAEYRPS
jgi:hypothetical protein